MKHRDPDAMPLSPTVRRPEGGIRVGSTLFAGSITSSLIALANALLEIDSPWRTVVPYLATIVAAATAILIRPLIAEFTWRAALWNWRRLQKKALHEIDERIDMAKKALDAATSKGDKERMKRIEKIVRESDEARDLVAFSQLLDYGWLPIVGYDHQLDLTRSLAARVDDHHQAPSSDAPAVRSARSRTK